MDIGRFTYYYNSYSRLVMKVAFSILKDFDLAQDVCQDTFVKLMQLMMNKNKVDEDTIKAWLVLCAKRRAVDYSRMICKQNQLKDAVQTDRGNLLISNYQDVSDIICEAELTSEFFLKLRNENTEWFDIITRICINGEDPNKVALDMNLTLNNVRTKLHRAKIWSCKILGVKR